jgi:hypothetical protein
MVCRGIWARLFAAIAAVAALAVLPPAARADPSPTELSPADGATIRASRNGAVFTFRIALPSEAHIEVATSPALGQDGTLSNDDQVDFESAFPSDSDPTLYTARTTNDGLWVNRPGVYYWQAAGFAANPFQLWAGPVYKLTVKAGSDFVSDEDLNRLFGLCAVRGGRADRFARRVRLLRDAIAVTTARRQRATLRKRLRAAQRSWRTANNSAVTTCRRYQRLRNQ